MMEIALRVSTIGEGEGAEIWVEELKQSACLKKAVEGNVGRKEGKLGRGLGRLGIAGELPLVLSENNNP